MKFGRIDLTKTTYSVTLDAHLLNPVPVDEINRVYKAYCLYKKFKSIMPLVPGRFLVPGTEVFGYYEQHRLMYFESIEPYMLKLQGFEILGLI